MRKTQRQGCEMGQQNAHVMWDLSLEHETYFFMMMYLSAFPIVWPSSRNSNEAAVSVEPGSWQMR